jgi:hypothetical protein
MASMVEGVWESGSLVIGTRCWWWARWLRWCNDWVTSWMVQSLNTGKGKRFFSYPKWPAWPVGNTQLLIHWVLSFFPGNTAAACWVTICNVIGICWFCKSVANCNRWPTSQVLLHFYCVTCILIFTVFKFTSKTVSVAYKRFKTSKLLEYFVVVIACFHIFTVYSWI